ncbi:hypothetical protein DMJ37_24450 [Vibrio parahaemolyticus]|nr:hypothetical protein D0871_07005 [Vibrio parahaemolyticus]EGQ9446072.1 hypothetical protein [Vibrio parahaemolyticus]EGR3370957.1 hypothetical protein [Vibrio parahaemolyticus]OXD12050.1 hypothetical protein CA166_04920 [Vibrio parahaemolyticus]TOE89000.1 hypothetical protein CGJ32_24020 [Vibrio parahaemolyticus]
MRCNHLYNKAFKSDSQRLAVSLRSSIANRRSHLNAALCVLPTPAYLLVLEPRKTASVLDHRASGAAN